MGWEKGICHPLRDLLPFVQFKKREKHPWRSVNFSKVRDFSLNTPHSLQLTLLHECFLRFLNCTNGTKSRNASHISKVIGVIDDRHMGQSIQE